MDQRADDLEQNIADTRHDIEETRASMSEKLELLEERVRDTLVETKTAVGDIVENVKDTVDGTLDAVKETVGDAKSTVENIVENVKGTMDDTVTMVKQSFDLRYQVEQHPWLMVGGSVIVGSILANLRHRRHETPRYSSYSSDPGQYVADTTQGMKLYSVTGKNDVTTNQANSMYTQAPPQRGWGHALGQFEEEFNVVKGAVMGAIMSNVMGALKEVIRQNMPSIASRFDKAVTQIETKWETELDKSSADYKATNRSDRA